jgi:hypothetical protein
MKASEPAKRIYFDLMDLIPQQSLRGSQYVLVFIDD